MEKINITNVRWNQGFKALQPGEGFEVSFTGQCNFDDRQANRLADELDIVGQRVLGHDTTFAAVKTRIAAAIDTYADEVQDFIAAWNDEVDNPEDGVNSSTAGVVVKYNVLQAAP